MGRPLRWAAAAFLAAALAHAPSISTPLLYDDGPAIAGHGEVRGERPIALTRRCLTTLSFRIDRLLWGWDVRGFHATSLLLHASAAALLFGILRRTLERERPDADADLSAFAGAAAWGVHPALTQPVGYLSQRAELLAGMLALAALYATVRRAGGGAPLWAACAAACGAFAMGAKESAAVVPLLVLLWDAALLAGSFRGALRARGGLYALLAAGWILLAALLAPGAAGGSGTAAGGAGADLPADAGFPIEPASRGEYLMAQGRILWTYLRLALWPGRLVFDYALSPAETVSAPLAALSAALLALAAWGVLRRPRSTLPLAWLILALLPSSSLVPLWDLAAEHRLYLPLAGLSIVLARAVAASPPRSGAALASATLALLAAGSVRRHADYRSAARIWADTAAKRPASARAWANLGAELHAARFAPRRAVACYARALAIRPGYATARANLGLALAQSGRAEEGIEHLREALRSDPENPAWRANLALALRAAGRADEAERLERR